MLKNKMNKNLLLLKELAKAWYDELFLLKNHLYI